MRTLALIVLASSISISTYAADNCSQAVSEKLERAAEDSGVWTFEQLAVLDRELAIEMIVDARQDSSTSEERQKALEEARLSDRLFYSVFWTAPSNSGTTVVVVNSKNCEILAEIIYESEE
ncbi:MAG: hypothetical protein AB7G93_01775 [Bdellovibrionales bacterium]